MAAPRRDKLVKQIARDLYLREDVVADVLDRFVDVAIEEIVNTGEFKLTRFLSVSSVDYKGYESGKGYVEPHQRLKIRLSHGISRLFQLRQKRFGGSTEAITRDNWREVLAEESPVAPATKPQEKLTSSEDFFNPLLDDDE